MKSCLEHLIVVAVMFLSARLAAQPSITAQPVGRTNNVGDNAQFTVTATGSGTLNYQWQFNGANISGATSNTFNVLIADTSKAGTYRVRVSDASNLTNTSSDATLSVFYDNRTKIAHWNFNSTTADTNTSTGVATPSVGSGTLTVSGASANGFGDGSSSDPNTLDNSSRRWNGLSPSATNKTAGVKYAVSTLGYQNVAVSGELWLPARGSAYWRGQYTTNGTDWVDRVLINRRGANLSGFVYFSDDLSGVAEVKENTNFAYRVVAEYESTATGSGSSGYVAVDPAQTFPGTGGLFGWDMFNVFGAVNDGTTQPAITTQPQSQTNYVGSTATFTVAATGGGLKYLWRFESQQLAQTNSSLVITNLQFANAGNYSVVVSNSSGSITSAVAVLTIQASPPPGDRYWSADAVTQGGAGTWDATTPNRWGVDVAGPYPFSWNNNNLDNAIFGGTAGAVALGSDVTVNKITGANNYSVTGANTITFSGIDSGVIMGGSGSITFSCKLNGNSLTKSGTGQIFLSNNGNTVGKYIVNGGTLASSVGNLGAPASLVTDFVTLDGGNLGFEATSVNLGANRGIYLGTGGGLIAAKSGATVTFTAPITGPGGVTLPGSNFGQGNAYGANNIPYIFSNPNNDYQGGTAVARGELRLGASDVLPNTTTVTISGANGQLNLNGKTDTVTGIIVNGSGARITDSVGGGVLNITGTMDLRQSGTGSSGIVGVLSGAGSVVKTTANTVELSGANTFTGNTTISAGTLALTGAGSVANSPAISIASGATLDVTGRTDGMLALGDSQTLSGAGAVAGAVLVGGTLAPGSSPGALSTGSETWNGGGAYDWEISSATGTAGTNWDVVNITGNLDVQASSANPFIIRMKSLNVASPGNMADFNPDTPGSWSLATVSGTIQNFSADKFILDSSSVSNDLAGGQFLIETNAGLNIRFTNNHPPIASGANFIRSQGVSWKIKISDLLAASTSDADGHARELVNVGVDIPATKGLVTVVNGYLFYDPTDINATNSDIFSFRVKDLAPYRAGDSVRQAVANIQLSVTDRAGVAQGIEVIGSSVVVRFAGIPGYRYSVERATDMNFTQNFTVLDIITAPRNGLFSVTDNNPPSPTAYYRLRYNPL